MLSIRKYKSVSLFTFSSLTLDFAGLISGFIVYRWIDPYWMGIWQGLLLIDTYSQFLRMGIINGMNRELPFSVGRGDSSQANRYAETTLIFTLLNILFFIVMFSIGYAFIDVHADWKLPIAAILFIVSVNFYNNYLLGTFRASADFEKLSIIQFLNAALRLASIIMVVFFGFVGFCIREVLLLLTITTVTHLWRPLKVRPRFELRSFKILLKTGLPIFAGSYLVNVAGSLPRLFLLNHSSVVILGIYAPVLSLLSAMAIVPDSFGAYFYPKMSHQLGATSDPKGLWSKTLFVHLALLVVGIPIIFLGWFSIPPFLNNFLPKYVDSREPLLFGLFIGIFLVFKFGFTTLAVLKSWKLMSVYVATFLSLQYVLPEMFLRYFTPLRAVMAGQLLTAMIMFGVSIATNYLATHPADHSLSEVKTS